jgi:DNA-binding NarL/FixJ family response regulator
MPDVNGIVALETIKREQPGLPVVMLSTSIDPTTVRHCLKLGATGFVAKQSAFDELAKAVHAVIAGEEYLCKVVRKAQTD